MCTNSTAPSVPGINRILRMRDAERAAAEFARAAGFAGFAGASFYPSIPGSLKELSTVLKDMTQFNPKALTLFSFRNITFKIDSIRDNEPLYSRIYELSIDWTDSAFDITLAKGVSCFHFFALNRLHNLKQVTVILPTVDPAKTCMIFEHNWAILPFLHKDIPAERSHYKSLSVYDEERGQIDVTVERSDEYPQFDAEPELAFKNLLEKLKHCTLHTL